MNQERTGWMVLLPTLVVWALSMLGVVSSAPRSTSSAPAEHTSGSPSRENTIVARLWEDPLAAVQAERFRTRKEVIEDDAQRAREGGEATAPRPGVGVDKLVLVWLKGQPFEEDREWRRRTRFALSAAMWSYDWAPAHGSKLNYRNVTFDELWPGPGTEPVKSPSSVGGGFHFSTATPAPVDREGEPWALRVPYETFERAGETVQVLWLNADLFDDRPLMRIGRLLEVWGGRAPTVVLGPPGTDRLLGLLRESVGFGRAVSAYRRESVVRSGGTYRSFEVWSPWATGDVTAEEMKARELAPSGPNEPLELRSEDSYDGSEITAQIVRTVPTDAKAVEAIFKELELRGATPGTRDELLGGHQRMALVAEWDSGFGRAFVQSATTYVVDDKDGKRRAGQFTEVYHYIRGIDGQPPDQARRPTDLPTESHAKPAAEGNSGTSAVSALLDPKAQPNPEGTAQTDYLVRLANALQESDREKQARGIGPLRAVGLVSTDLNDRLLMLKALTPRLPDAIFFATELEASYLLPEHNWACRNLIVACPWALSDTEAERESDNRRHLLPPLRDSAQRALIHALAPLLNDCAHSPRPEAPPHRIFEVGLRHIHSLPLVKGKWQFAKDEETQPVDKNCPVRGRTMRWIIFVGAIFIFVCWGAYLWVERPASPVASGKQSAAWLLGAALIMVAVGMGIGRWSYAPLAEPVLLLSLLLLCLPRVPIFLRRGGWFRFFSLIGLGVLTLAGHWCATHGGEPRVLADGVSLWPAVGLRLLASGLAVWFTRQAIEELRANAGSIEKQFFWDDAPGGRERRQFPSTAQMPFTGGSMHGWKDDEQLQWKDYLDRSNATTGAYCVRWAVATFASLLVAALLMAAFGMPSANTRGDLAGTWDGVSLFVSLVTFLGLMVFVVDQNMRCQRFLRLILEHGKIPYGFELEEAVSLIAQRSAAVGQIVLYPFTVVFILGCAQTSYIEDWRGLGGLYAVFGAALGLVFISTWRMEREAGSLRTRTITRLQQRLTDALWVKRLLHQRLDFAAVGLDFTRRANASARAISYAPQIADQTDTTKLDPVKLGAMLERWWRDTLERLARQVVPPEPLRLLTAIPAVIPLIPIAEPADYIKTLDEELKPYRDLDVAFYDARASRLERLITTIRELNEGAFGTIWERPLLRALLIPGAGFGSLGLLQSFLGN